MPDAQQLLAQQLRPALVLDAHGIILDTNHGSDRLIALPQLPAAREAQNTLIGRNISQVGLELRPRRPPILSSWSHLLDAAVHVTRLDDQQDATTANSIHASTDKFWDAEYARQGIVESDIYMTRRSSEHDPEDEEHSSTIGARVIIHWVSRGLVDEGSFLVTIDRPSLLDGSVPDEAASGLFNSIDNAQGASASPSDAHPEEAQPDTKHTSNSGDRKVSGKENMPLVASSISTTCATNASNLTILTQLREMLTPIHGITGMSACLVDAGLPKDQASIAKCIFENSKFLRAAMSDVFHLGICQVQPGLMDGQSARLPVQPLHSEKYNTICTRSGSIPKHAPAQPAVPRSFAPLPQLDIHILLVEKNVINRKILTKMAEKSGYRMNIVDTGQDALQYLCRTSQQPRPKVVLMNCKMQAPPIDGYEATRRIRNDYTMFDVGTRSLPIIGLTIAGHGDDVDKCWSAGMDDFMSKPVAMRVFKDTMIKWMVARKSHKMGHMVDAKL
jgi:CheY-like chemotaxis protein